MSTPTPPRSRPVADRSLRSSRRSQDRWRCPACRRPPLSIGPVVSVMATVAQDACCRRRCAIHLHAPAIPQPRARRLDRILDAAGRNRHAGSAPAAASGRFRNCPACRAPTRAVRCAWRCSAPSAVRQRPAGRQAFGPVIDLAPVEEVVEAHAVARHHDAAAELAPRLWVMHTTLPSPSATENDVVCCCIGRHRLRRRYCSVGPLDRLPSRTRARCALDVCVRHQRGSFRRSGCCCAMRVPAARRIARYTASRCSTPLRSIARDRSHRGCAGSAGTGTPRSGGGVCTSSRDTPPQRIEPDGLYRFKSAIVRQPPSTDLRSTIAWPSAPP